MKAVQVTDMIALDGIVVDYIELDDNGNGLPAIVLDNEKKEKEKRIFIDENYVRELVSIHHCEKVECGYEECEECDNKQSMLIEDVGVVELGLPEIFKYPGTHYITVPQENDNKCILVFWEVSTTMFGDAAIEANEDVLVLGRGEAYYTFSAARRKVKTVQMLAVLKQGQYLLAKEFDLNTTDKYLRLRWDGLSVVTERHYEKGSWDIDLFVINHTNCN